MSRLTRLVCATVVFFACTSAPASARFEVGPSQPGPRWVEAGSQPASHLIASIRSGAVVDLRARPSGPVLARVGDRTPFGSPRTFSIVQRVGRWLQVTDPALAPGRVGWIEATHGLLRYSHTAFELEVDLSSRTLVVRRGSSVLRRIVVDIGAPQSPTPTGRYAVTDELAGAAYSPAYGCCILALSARQTHLPATWHGGDRVAIHGTHSNVFGRAISNGCVHVPTSALRYLMRTIALGTPVVIHP